MRVITGIEFVNTVETPTFPMISLVMDKTELMVFTFVLDSYLSDIGWERTEIESFLSTHFPVDAVETIRDASRQGTTLIGRREFFALGHSFTVGGTPE